MWGEYMKCPECKSKFTFTERFKLASTNNQRIVCSRCKNTFEKDGDFNVFDFVIGLILNISTVIIFITLSNINMYITVCLAMVLGLGADYAYLFLIQNIRKYKKIK